MLGVNKISKIKKPQDDEEVYYMQSGKGQE